MVACSRHFRHFDDVDRQGIFAWFNGPINPDWAPSFATGLLWFKFLCGESKLRPNVIFGSPLGPFLGSLIRTLPLGPPRFGLKPPRLFRLLQAHNNALSFY